MTISYRSYGLLAAGLLLAAPFAAAAAAAPQAPTAASPSAQLDHISVQVLGASGPPVILIPGLSSPREAWSGVAPTLARTHRVYLVQVNGFGGDDPRANLGPNVLNGIVADLHRFIDERKLQGASLVGHSMGGLVGLMLAARHPENLSRLMVVDALPYFGVLVAPLGTDVTVAMVEPHAAKMRDLVAAGYGKPADAASIEANIAGMTQKAEHLPSLRAWAMASDPRVAAQAMYEDLTTDMRSELASIRVPVTVLYAWNQSYPRKDPAAAFFTKQYAGVARLTVTQAGESAHFIMLDQPTAFQAALAKFLQ
jgi:pimeloyl-ACP methyl ester carboxylesterase